MSGFDSWIIPFTLLPAVGLLILSTSNRFFYVYSVIRGFSEEYIKAHPDEVAGLMKRCRYFQSAMVFLYVAVACLAVSALLGYIHLKLLQTNVWAADGADILLLIGVSSFVIATSYLVRESVLFYRMVKKHIPGTPD